MTVVDDLSITIKRGELYGFLGLNGAGKTVTIRMLLAMIKPTEGSVSLFGEEVSPSSSSLWSRVGYLVERPSAYPELTVRENLNAALRLHLFRDREAVDTIIEKMGLREYEERKAYTLSTGNLQRLGLAKALIHEPELLILDEPSNGLDPAGVVMVRDMFRGLRGEGVTIFMSSHILGEVHSLTTRIGVIHEGRLIEEIDAADLESYSKKNLLIRTRDNEAAGRYLRSTGLDVVIEDGIKVRGQEALDYPDRIASMLVHAGFPPLEIQIERLDLESHFLNLVNREEIEP